jgi:hypothetical protein
MNIFPSVHLSTPKKGAKFSSSMQVASAIDLCDTCHGGAVILILVKTAPLPLPKIKG